jgi:hypothetical protein
MIINFSSVSVSWQEHMKAFDQKWHCMIIVKYFSLGFNMGRADDET